MAVMTNKKFVEKCVDIAKNYKTLYVLGCFGAPLNGANVSRYVNNLPYNKDRERIIRGVANTNTFGFDCVCLIKAILWGWTGDAKATYGGAKYGSNGVPDIGADSMIKKCKDVSSNFAKVEVGEVVWKSGHIGVYIGDGLAVECTPAWKNKVQITACNCDKDGYDRRDWVKHGKLPYLEYVKEAKPAQTKKPTVMEWQKAALADGFDLPKYGADGKWGAECEAVAKTALVKKRTEYKNKNLTKIVQRVVGVTADGLCGDKTVAAVKAWQKKNGLADDGVVGLNSWKKMLGV